MLSNMRFRQILVVFLALLTLGCALSTTEIQDKSRNLLQQIINENRQLHGLGLIVRRVDALKEKGGKYKGFAKVEMDGKAYSVSMDISVDGDKVQVTPEPGAFLFISPRDTGNGNVQPEIPVYDTNSVCKMNKDCINGEREVLGTLRKIWAGVGIEAKNYCLAEAKQAKNGAYINLLNCFSREDPNYSGPKF